MSERRRKAAHGVELGAGIPAGAIGSSFGAAKLRDAYRDDPRFGPEKLAEHAKKFGRFAPVVEEKRPGFRPLLATAVLGSTAGAARRYGQHLDRQAQKRTTMTKSAFGIEHDVVEKRFFSAQARRKDAKQGDALPGGKLPIKNRQDLTNAERLAGKVKGVPPKKVRAYLHRKEEEFGVSKARGLYDSEHNRQQRNAAQAGALGTAGAGLGVMARGEAKSAKKARTSAAEHATAAAEARHQAAGHLADTVERTAKHRNFSMGAASGNHAVKLPNNSDELGATATHAREAARAFNAESAHTAQHAEALKTAAKHLRRARGLGVAGLGVAGVGAGIYQHSKNGGRSYGYR